MATKTLYILSTAAVTPNWWGSLQDGGSAPGAANSAYGWAPAKVAVTTPYYPAHVGATGTVASGTAVAASTIASKSGPTKGTGSAATTSGDSFVAGPYSGTFASGAWTLSLMLRAGTAGCIGHLNMRVWKSANADGSSATELTAGSLVGTAVTLSTTADVNGMGTTGWSPGAITLNNEYLFFQLEWQETTAGTSNSDTVLFRLGTCLITTTNFAAAWAGTAGLVPAPALIANEDMLMATAAALAPNANLVVNEDMWMAAAAQFGSPTLKNGLVSCWEFENTSWLDSAPAGNTLTAANGPTTTTGKVGSGVLLTSNNPNSPTLRHATTAGLNTGGSFTVAAWVKVGGGSKPIIQKIGGGFPFNGFTIYVGFTDTFHWIFGAQAGGSSGPVASPLVADGSNFQFVVGLWDAPNKTAYISVNNEAMVGQVNANPMTDDGTDFYIGDPTQSGGDPILDQVGFWNRLLTQAEIGQLYNGGVGLAYAQFSPSVEVLLTADATQVTGGAGPTLWDGAAVLVPEAVLAAAETMLQQASASANIAAAFSANEDMLMAAKAALAPTTALTANTQMRSPIFASAAPTTTLSSNEQMRMAAVASPAPAVAIIVRESMLLNSNAAFAAAATLGADLIKPGAVTAWDGSALFAAACAVNANARQIMQIGAAM